MHSVPELVVAWAQVNGNRSRCSRADKIQAEGVRNAPELMVSQAQMKEEAMKEETKKKADRLVHRKDEAENKQA